MRIDRPASRPLLTISLLLSLLTGLLLPWLLAQSAPLTLNAYDLAEWASLHPLQSASNPPLAAPLLLRVHLVILCALVGAAAQGNHAKRAAALVIVALAVAQLPPIEFVNDLANLNYRQQFGLALASLFLGIPALRWVNHRWQPAWVAGCGLLGLLTTLAGATLALDVFASLASGGSAGLGIWIVAASYVSLFGVGFRALVVSARSQM
ncbi:MAG: hypothetical protein OXE95_04560 [Chloroflexi bacterium]|nr:hypothetical protein [Chloroflexota bacterium]MCY4246836.1 hypothetical protein [Chloroflexota bacterium]